MVILTSPFCSRIRLALRRQNRGPGSVNYAMLPPCTAHKGMNSRSVVCRELEFLIASTRSRDPPCSILFLYPTKKPHDVSQGFGKFCKQATYYCPARPHRAGRWFLRIPPPLPLRPTSWFRPLRSSHSCLHLQHRQDPFRAPRPPIWA